MIQLGILSALSQEAKVLTQASKIGMPLQVAEDVLFIRAGIGHANAHRCAVQLQEGGIDALMSFGVCGGIDPSLKNGDILLPTAVTDGLETISVSANWRAAIQDVLSTGPSSSTTQFHVNNPVASPAEKKMLHEKSGAAGIDMESFAIAQVAREANLPFLVLRVVLDDAYTRLPVLALRVTGENGEVHAGRLLTGLLKHPLEVPALFRLGGQMNRAIKVLRSTMQQAGPRFLCDHV